MSQKNIVNVTTEEGQVWQTDRSNRAGQKTKKMRLNLNSPRVAPYIFVLPFVLIFAVFFIYPIGNTIMMSFQSVNFNDIRFVGLENYRALFSSSILPIAIRNSLTYMIFTLLVLIPFPVILACMLNSKSMRGGSFFRAVLFLPILCSVVVAGLTFRFLFNETDTALVNTMVINLFGGERIRWLSERWPAMAVMVILATWRWTGMNIIYFLSGLNNIPVELYEACEVDGANTWQKFRYITIPLLMPTIIYVLTISIYGGLAMFVESHMLWAGRSSPRNIGLTIVGLIYQEGVSHGNFGFASAAGLLLLAVVLGINLFQLRLTGGIGKEEN
jgi:arabinosaccharide transport system permease protein